jgi:hypothetical protein
MPDKTCRDEISTQRLCRCNDYARADTDSFGAAIEALELYIASKYALFRHQRSGHSCSTSLLQLGYFGRKSLSNVENE